MAVGGVGDDGDHYVISEPYAFEVTAEDLQNISQSSVSPYLELITPGAHASKIAVAGHFGQPG